MSNVNDSQAGDPASNDSRDSATQAFLGKVNDGPKPGNKTSVRASRPESVREHGNNALKALRYSKKMLYGEGPRDDTDESEDEDNGTSVRNSHYNRITQKEKMNNEVALLGPVATVFTIFKGFVATAILFMPYAFVKSGWAFSGGALLASLLLVLYAISLLLSVNKEKGGSLPEMGERTWGRPGKILTDVLLFSSQFGFCLAYVYFVIQQVGGTFILCWTNDAATPTLCPPDSGTNLTQAPAKWLWIVVCMCLFTPLVLVRKTEKFAFTHIFADIMVILALGMVSYFASVEISKNGFKPIAPMTPEFSFSISYAVFAFEGVGVVLPIMEITENKEQYFSLLVGTLIVIFLIFVSFCEYAAFAYGEEELNAEGLHIGGIQPLVLQDLPQNSVVTWVLACTYSVVVVFTYPLQIAPANNVLESYLFNGWEKGKKRQCGKNISRTVVVFLSCLVVVVLYDYISELLEIVAALTAIPMAFMLPPLFHLKLENISTCAKVADWLLVAFALTISVYCAYNGKVTLIEKLGESE